MKHAYTTIVSLSLLAGLLYLPDSAPTRTTEASVTAMSAPMPVESPEDTPSVRIVTERRSDLAEWALDRFAAAGLELPALEIAIHSDIEDCKGNNGLYRNTGLEIEVHVCAPWPSRIERALLHELGHAWADAKLTAAQEAAFLELRGLEEWDGVEWDRQGFEHAAEILMWGLSEEAFPLTSIADTDAESLAEAFHLLTGLDPLNASPHNELPEESTGTPTGPLA
jgi:hypothetical protein